MKRVVFDIEADSNIPNKVNNVWCLVIQDLDNDQSLLFTYEQGIETGIEILRNADLVVGHNIIGYDLPVLKNKFSLNIPLNKVHDTFILSQLLYPNEMTGKGLKGFHGLGDWGKILGYPKGDFDRWDDPCQEMYDYCKRDVELNTKVYYKMLGELNQHDWSAAIALEQKVYEIYSTHQTHWYLDTDLLPKSIDHLTSYSEKLRQQIIGFTKPRIIHNGKETKAFTKEGKLTSIVQKYANKHCLNIVGDFCKVSFEEFNLKSPSQVVQWFLELGWKPETFSDKTGEPITRDDPLHGVPSTITKPYLEFKKCIHKLTQIEGWADKSYEDGKIDQFALTCGTPTSRFRHSIIVNVPGPTDHPVFGEIMRKLFVAPKEYKLVGADASALEARMEAHFTTPLDGGLYADMLLNGDIHQLNADSWGMERNDTKAIYYGMSYGAQVNKVASMTGFSRQRASEIYQKYWEDRPAVVALLDQLHSSIISRNQGFMDRGKLKLNTSCRPWIKGLDSRRLYVRSSHSLKNTLIQSGGTLVMKVGYCYVAKEIEKQGLDARIVMFYHDEIEVIAKDDGVTPLKVKKILEDGITKGGKHFNLLVDIEAEGKIGNNWHDVH